MNTITIRGIQCFVIATVRDADGTVIADLTCQLPGGRPCHRAVPYNRLRRGNEVEGAPICHTIGEFEAWVHATYGG